MANLYDKFRNPQMGDALAPRMKALGPNAQPRSHRTQEMLMNYFGNVIQGNYAKNWLREMAQLGQQAMPQISPEGQVSPGDPQAALEIAMQFAPLGITAYHGSPHKFSKFSTKHIGSGEGAQAYGHGLYFAENPKVAKEYANLRPITDPTDGAFITARSYFAKGEGDINNALKYLDEQKDLTIANKKFLVDGGKKMLAEIDEAKKIISSGQLGASHLYKVDIADDAVKNFLDWDKPLSEQSPAVKAEIERLWRRVYDEPIERMGAIDGAGFYEDLVSALGVSQEGASQILNKAGIKGIKYLDQGSRKAGKGTSNYVVFDENIIKMLGKE